MRIKFFPYVNVNFYRAIAIILLVALAEPSPIFAADDNNGTALLQRCKSVNQIGRQGVVLDKAETYNLMYCLGYFSGFTGMYYNTAMQDNFKTTPFCLPPGANWKPLARIVVDFLEQHPELMHQPQEALTVMALSEKFPCRDQNTQ